MKKPLPADWQSPLPKKSCMSTICFSNAKKGSRTTLESRREIASTKNGHKKARKCLVPNFHVARNWIWAWHWDTAAVWPCLESDSLIPLKPSHYAWFLEAVTLSLIPSKPSHYAWFPWTSWSCHTKFDSLEAFTLCLIPSKPSHYAWFPWSLHTMRDSCHTCMSTSCLLVLSLRASHDY